MPRRFFFAAKMAMRAILIVAILGFAPTATHAADPKAAFDKTMAEVAKTQTNSVAETTAMEKAIAAARAVKPPPAVPDATIAFEGRAEAAAKAAKDKSGFKAAADEFGKAARVAPWVPAYHFNRGVLLEKAEDYVAAKRSLELYLKAAPNAQDTREVKKKIAGLDYLASRPKTAATLTPDAKGPSAMMQPEANIAGIWWQKVRDRSTEKNSDTFYDIVRIGKEFEATPFTRELFRGRPITAFPKTYRIRIDGNKVTGAVTYNLRQIWSNLGMYRHSVQGTISSDLRVIVIDHMETMVTGATGDIANGTQVYKVTTTLVRSK